MKWSGSCPHCQAEMKARRSVLICSTCGGLFVAVGNSALIPWSLDTGLKPGDTLLLRIEAEPLEQPPAGKPYVIPGVWYLLAPYAGWKDGDFQVLDRRGLASIDGMSISGYLPTSRSAIKPAQVSAELSPEGQSHGPEEDEDRDDPRQARDHALDRLPIGAPA